MKYAAVTFIDGIKNRVLLSLTSTIRKETAADIARELSRNNRTVVQIYYYDQRVLTVSVA